MNRDGQGPERSRREPHPVLGVKTAALTAAELVCVACGTGYQHQPWPSRAIGALAVTGATILAVKVTAAGARDADGGAGE